jgi:hypothetical protein
MNMQKRQPFGLDFGLSAIFAMVIIIFGASSLKSQPYTIFDMSDFSSQELRRQPFSLGSDMDLEIDIIGARHQDSDQMYALGWIIDSKTREVVWSMSEEATRRMEDDRKLRRFDGTIYLDKGDYEAYYFAGNPLQAITKFNFKEDIEGLGDLIGVVGDVFDDEFAKDGQLYFKQTKKFKFVLSADKNDFHLRDDKAPRLPNQFISLVRSRNLSDERAAFTISAQMDIEIYAIGEYSESNDVFMDGAKIINAKTRDVVWAMERWNTDWAGGALKNRCFHDEINLKPGEYIVHYWTDESHTFDDWNGTPPYDPYFWGITLALTSQQYADNVKSSDIEQRKEVIVQIIKVGDDANLARDFTLKRDMKINIYAIGEGRKGYMYDYGWIERQGDDSIVWMMKEDSTDHAGGAIKNRVYDGIINLKAGDYVLRYKSDGSHSYNSWNAAQPSDARHYGITLYAYDEDYSRNMVEVGPLKSLGGPLAPGTPGQVIITAPAPPTPEEIEELKSQYEEINQEYLEEIQDLKEEMMESPHDLEAMEDYRKELEGLQKEYMKQVAELKKEHNLAKFEWNDKGLFVQMQELEQQMRALDKKNFIQVSAPGSSSGYLVKISSVGNDANLQASFHLDSPSRVRIYALGEGLNGGMFDYGWITNHKTGDIIWEMTYRKTEHAGGAAKNRKFDGVIMLDKGDYDVYYVTDDSHSYDSWNDYGPADPTDWGISLKLEK